MVCKCFYHWNCNQQVARSPLHCHVMTLDKLFSHICDSVTKQHGLILAVMFCSCEDSSLPFSVPSTHPRNLYLSVSIPHSVDLKASLPWSRHCTECSLRLLLVHYYLWPVAWAPAVFSQRVGKLGGLGQSGLAPSLSMSVSPNMEPSRGLNQSLVVLWSKLTTLSCCSREHVQVWNWNTDCKYCS